MYIAEYTNKFKEGSKGVDIMVSTYSRASPTYRAGLIKFERAAQNEATKLQYIINKVMQVYRLRLQYLNRRHQLLMSIERDRGNISNNPQFYSTLQLLLNRERKLIDIIRREDPQFGNKVKYAIGQFEEAKKNLKNLNAKNLQEAEKFLLDMVNFIQHMERDLVNIEIRMQKEEMFIERKDANSFNQFLLEWDSELKANEQLIKDCEGVIKRNKRVVIAANKKDPGWSLTVGLTAGTLSEVVGGILGAKPLIVGIQTGHIPSLVIGSLLMSAGVIVAMAGLITHFYNLVVSEKLYLHTDRQTIKHIEKMRGIKRGFLGRLFGK